MSALDQIATPMRALRFLVARTVAGTAAGAGRIHGSTVGTSIPRETARVVIA